MAGKFCMKRPGGEEENGITGDDGGFALEGGDVVGGKSERCHFGDC